MYDELNIWVAVFGLSFLAVCVLIIGIGYLADRRQKKKQDDFWKRVALEDLKRRPDTK